MACRALSMENHQRNPESASVIFEFSTTKGITLDELLAEDCCAVESGVRV